MYAGLLLSSFSLSADSRCACSPSVPGLIIFSLFENYDGQHIFVWWFDTRLVWLEICKNCSVVVVEYYLSLQSFVCMSTKLENLSNSVVCLFLSFEKLIISKSSVVLLLCVVCYVYFAEVEFFNFQQLKL